MYIFLENIFLEEHYFNVKFPQTHVLTWTTPHLSFDLKQCLDHSNKKRGKKECAEAEKSEHHRQHKRPRQENNHLPHEEAFRPESDRQAIQQR